MAALTDAIARRHKASLTDTFEKLDDLGRGAVDFRTFFDEVDKLPIELTPYERKREVIGSFFEQHSVAPLTSVADVVQDLAKSTPSLSGGNLARPAAASPRQTKHSPSWSVNNQFRYRDFEWRKQHTSALYVAISMSALQAVDVAWLIEHHGFRFHHYRPAGHNLDPEDERQASESDGSGELVYYCWPGIGGNGSREDPVPSYATAVEGATAVVLSADGERLLLVWERGAWSTPGGAVNAGESKLEALEREVYEELQAEIDLSRGATLVGGWSQSRARDNLINDSFAAFVVHLKHDAFKPDDKEIQEARFFEWRPLLEKWRAASRPAPRQGGSKSLQVPELGLPDAINSKGKAEGRNAVALNVLQWLDAYEKGGGLYCVHQSYQQGPRKASKVQYVGHERPTLTSPPPPMPTPTPPQTLTQTQTPAPTPAMSWAPEEA